MAPKSLSGFAPSNGGVTSSGLPPLLSPTQPFPPQRKPFPPAPPPWARKLRQFRDLLLGQFFAKTRAQVNFFHDF